MPARAAITRSMRAGSATRRASGARRRSDIDWIEPPKHGVRSRRRRLRPLVPRRRLQHLLERGRPPCDARAAARSRRSSTIRRSPDRSAPSPTTVCRPRPRCWPRILRDFGVGKGDRVILYMPMVPEAVVGMLACARIGAVHSVVFGGFAANELATRIDDAKPKVILSASCGIEPGRVVKYKPLLDEAIELADAQARRLPDPAASAGRGDAHRRPRPRLGRRCATRRIVFAQVGLRLRAGRRHRSALHPLHVRHDRPAEGRGARQRRPHGRAQMVDEEPLRHRAGRGLVVRLRHRLGGRPQLHRLCAAAPRLPPRSSTRASRSARPTPARSGA